MSVFIARSSSLDDVEVLTRRAGEPADTATRWRSTGEADFTVAADTKSERGTDVILHLKDDAKDFADGFRLRSIVRKYSDHIGVPVEMPKTQYEDDDDGKSKSKKKKKKKDVDVEWETVNSAKALWTRPRTELKDDDYKEFYKHVSHDFDDPSTWSHNKVEGKLEYTSLLYVPKHAPFDLWNRDAPRGLKLYVQRVFILDQADQFLPLYLRFIKGIVDCNDLPLNVSRELLQTGRTRYDHQECADKTCSRHAGETREVGCGRICGVLQGVRRSPEGRARRRFHESRNDCEIAPLLVDAYGR